MAKRGHTKKGDVVCSECGAIIDATAEKCELCGEELTEDFNATVCPYCGEVLESPAVACSNCGLKFKNETQGLIRSKEDEEFLSRLLDWGRKLEARRSIEPAEDIVETERASEVFQDVVGSPTPSIIQEEGMKELHESAKELDEFEKREQSIMQLAEPLRKALDARKKTLVNVEEKLAKLQKDLEGVGDKDVKAMKKRSEIERRMAEISLEKDVINTIEEKIENMDSAYHALLEKHKSGLIEKEEKLDVRFAAFKKEMDRREKEKGKLKSREDFLKDKEKEMQDRIQSLMERESSLKETEEKMKEEIEVLKADRDGMEDLKTPASKFIASKGQWLVDEKELKKILKKSKRAREAWLGEQQEIQKSLASGESEEQIEKESQERFAKREKELESKIKDLETKLTDAEKEGEEISKEEARLIADEKKLKKVLKVLDDLLGHLPDDMIEKFAKSKNYKLYEELMDELGL